MQMKIASLLDSQLLGSLLWTFVTCFLVTLASGSDPCPPASMLSPCWCTDFPLYTSRTTEAVTTETTPQFTSTPESIITEVTTSIFPDTSWSYGTEWSPQSTTQSVRKRRHVKRQIDPFSFFSRAAYYTEVSCNGTSVHELEEAIGRGLERRWVDKVTISNHSPDAEGAQVRLPNRLFRNARLKQFKITDTVVAGDFINAGEPFDGQAYSLMWFSANMCFLRGQLTYSDPGTIQTMGLHKLTRLQGLDLSNNNIEYIQDSAFRYPPANLTTLNISNNELKALGTWCFQKISKLRVLDLSHNVLVSVLRTMFPSKATYLSHINLSWNHLTTLPTNFFENMPALKIINVSYNYMHSMSANPWATRWRQMDFIDITGNYLSCDCSLTWLPPLLSSSEGNGTSTASPTHREQIVLGSCSIFQQDSYPVHYPLANLTSSSLDC